MSWFAGTATGRQYTVGAQYSMGGQTYRANSDGSFTSQQTGRTLQGSAGANVARGGGGSLAGDTVRTAAERGLVEELARRNGQPVAGRPAAGAGSGNRVVVSQPRGGAAGAPVPGAAVSEAVGNGPGNPAVVGGTPRGRSSWLVGPTTLGLNPQANQVTQLYVNGWALPINRGTSDGGMFEERYGEVGGAVAGIGVAVVDLVPPALRWVADTVTYGAAAPALPVVQQGVVDLARYLDERKAEVRKRDLEPPTPAPASRDPRTPQPGPPSWYEGGTVYTPPQARYFSGNGVGGNPLYYGD